MVRKWVMEALYAVLFDHAYANLVLKQRLKEVKEKDRKLATQIFYGTLQNYRYCEAIWKQYTKTNQKIPLKVKIILTMSVYQLLFLKKVPGYAIIDEAVEITKQTKIHLASFVNAILRKVEKGATITFKDEIEEIALTYSLPDWIIRLWMAQYGKEKTLAFAKASIQSLPLSVRARKDTPLDNRFVLLKAPIYAYQGSNLEHQNLYLEGKISPQDLGAYEIVRFLEVKKGDTILDACAAPGTKTMAIAELLDGEGRVDALDIHEHRVQLIENDKRRLHLENVKTYTMDATDLSALDFYDKILCDVPCSGYGTLSRKPDIKLTMEPNDMDALIPLQYAILQEASSHLKDGGILVYSTCTLNKKENEKQVEHFLKEHPDFVKIEEQTIVPTNINNGFYMAKLQKKAGKEDHHEKHL